MADSPDDMDGTPKPESKTTLWSSYGCFVWLAVPWMVAIPVWLFVFPDSYDRALDLVMSSLALLVIVMIAATSVFGVLGNRNSLVLGYLFPVWTVGLACVAGWNIVALYTTAGIRPKLIFGWEYSARPEFYFWSLLASLLLLAVARPWFGKAN